MSEFAKIAKDGTVETVIVIEPEMLATGRWGDPAEWVKNDPAKRKNCAGIGYSYDKTRDAFIPPRPANALSLDEATCQWVVPKPDKSAMGGING